MDLKEKAKLLPHLPGCYLMLKHGQIIYIGKAKDLKKRVISYFGVTTGKTFFLMQQVDDFDFFITANEAEALLLENNLIKKHSPKYNISLKDDRRFPFIQVSKMEKYPRLLLVRKPNFKNNHIFGPFVTGARVLELITLLSDNFNLRTCNNLKNKKHPCLRFHLKLCSAPCTNLQKDYGKRLKLALKTFSDSKKIVTFLTKRMKEFSKEERFEEASKIRDDLSNLQAFLDRMSSQQVEYLEVKDLDVIGLHEGKEAIDIVILIIRNGFLIGKQNFFIYDKEELVDLIFDYYAKNKDLPPLIDWRGDELLIDSLKLLNQSVGKYLFDNLQKLANDTARENQRLREAFKYSRMEALRSLSKLIASKPIFLMECFDIAIFNGKSPTASKIVFYQGYPHKNEYRYYTLSERPEGNNDFAMLEEALVRRLKDPKLPDLFIVDGGKLQLSVFNKVLEEHQIKIPVIAIAKIKGDKEERIYFKDQEFILKEDPAMLSLITAIRDEAHRFARKLHKIHEHKRIFD